MFVKYCDDVTPRGLCGYRDEDIICSCDETSMDNPKREQFLLPMHGLTSIGECQVDSVSLSGQSVSWTFSIFIPCLES